MDWIRRVLLTTLCAAPLFAAAPPARPDGRDIAVLLRQLGDRDFARREAAHRRLAAAGPSALPAFTRALSSPDPEVRRRLLRLIGVLERERDFSPKRVTATFRDASIKAVLAEFRAQTGLKVQPGPFDREPPRFTGAFRDATFWEAIDALCASGSLVPQDGEMEQRGGVVRHAGISLVPARRASRFVSRDGPFRVSVHRVEQQRILDLDDDDGNDRPPTVGLHLSCVAEPRYEFVEVGEPRLESATDDRGRSLLPVGADALPENPGEEVMPPSPDSPVAGAAQIHFNVVLSRHFADSRRVRRLTGVLPARVIVGRSTRVLLDRLARGRVFELHGNGVTVEQVKAQRSRTEVRLRLAKPLNPMTDHDLGTEEDLPYNVEFQDEAGRRCHHTVMAPAGPRTLVVRVRASRPGGRPPVRVVVREAVVRPVEVRFDLHDLPLP